MNTEYFQAWCPEKGQTQATADLVMARDAQKAAQQWAAYEEERTQAEQSAGDGGNTFVVCVRGLRDMATREKIREFLVFGQRQTGYTAKAYA